ncbi:hypothetical protein [Micromonospora chersina]|uniref:hypothetical protein n=1 Tax=Micromonospora chersina TaxID=47854 RepID=UPI0033ABF08E
MADHRDVEVASRCRMFGDSPSCCGPDEPTDLRRSAGELAELVYERGSSDL